MLLFLGTAAQTYGLAVDQATPCAHHGMSDSSSEMDMSGHVMSVVANEQTCADEGYCPLCLMGVLLPVIDVPSPSVGSESRVAYQARGNDYLPALELPPPRFR